MLASSHITNECASPYVRTCLADFPSRFSHNANMARRGIPKGPSTWYLREWMASKGIKTQARMMELTGWSKATMSQLYNDQQDFSPKLLKEAAHALGVEPYELLLTPEKANAIRSLRQHALRVVETTDSLDERTGTQG